MTRLALFITLIVTLAAGCGGDDTPASGGGSGAGATDGKGDQVGATPDPVAGAPEICVAVRGNGQLVTAHFHALARLAEHFGPFAGIAGGSSASITSFLTESMHMHPGVATCAGAPCSRSEAGARIALMYKSLLGYLAAMGERDEAVTLRQVLALVEQAKASGVEALIAEEAWADAAAAIEALLQSEDVAGLVNAELLGILSQSPDPATHVQQIWAQLSSFGAFDAGDPSILVQPGLVDFTAFARLVGRIGSFYAAYGPADLDAWEAFFGACATPGRGLPWPAVATVADAGGVTCGDRFGDLLADWRGAWLADEANQANRVDDPVGASLRAMAVTSVLTGDAVDTWKIAYGAWTQAEPWTLEIDFADVQVGYWGAAKHVTPAVADVLGFGDAKTAKALDLGQATWAVALANSPAEPGLARAQELSPGQISAGGWPDLEPVQALRNAGCEHVVYVTRRGPESRFARGVAGLLGMTEADDAALYDPASEKSAFSEALAEASGVWCTNWDDFEATDIGGLTLDAWDAPLEVHDADLLAGDDPYPNTSDRLGVVGCTPGWGE